MSEILNKLYLNYESLLNEINDNEFNNINLDKEINCLNKINLEFLQKQDYENIFQDKDFQFHVNSRLIKKIIKLGNILLTSLFDKSLLSNNEVENCIINMLFVFNKLLNEQANSIQNTDKKMNNIYLINNEIPRDKNVLFYQVFLNNINNIDILSCLFNYSIVHFSDINVNIDNYVKELDELDEQEMLCYLMYKGIKTLNSEQMLLPYSSKSDDYFSYNQILLSNIETENKLNEYFAYLINKNYKHSFKLLNELLKCNNLNNELNYKNVVKYIFCDMFNKIDVISISDKESVYSIFDITKLNTFYEDLNVNEEDFVFLFELLLKNNLSNIEDMNSDDLLFDINKKIKIFDRFINLKNIKKEVIIQTLLHYCSLLNKFLNERNSIFDIEKRKTNIIKSDFKKFISVIFKNILKIHKVIHVYNSIFFINSVENVSLIKNYYKSRIDNEFLLKSFAENISLDTYLNLHQKFEEQVFISKYINLNLILNSFTDSPDMKRFTEYLFYLNSFKRDVNAEFFLMIIENDVDVRLKKALANYLKNYNRFNDIIIKDLNDIDIKNMIVFIKDYDVDYNNKIKEIKKEIKQEIKKREIIYGKSGVIKSSLKRKLKIIERTHMKNLFKFHKFINFDKVTAIFLNNKSKSYIEYKAEDEVIGITSENNIYSSSINKKLSLLNHDIKNVSEDMSKIDYLTLEYNQLKNFINIKNDIENKFEKVIKYCNEEEKIEEMKIFENYIDSALLEIKNYKNILKNFYKDEIDMNINLEKNKYNL